MEQKSRTNRVSPFHVVMGNCLSRIETKHVSSGPTSSAASARAEDLYYEAARGGTYAHTAGLGWIMVPHQMKMFALPFGGLGGFFFSLFG